MLGFPAAPKPARVTEPRRYSPGPAGSVLLLRLWLCLSQFWCGRLSECQAQREENGTFEHLLPLTHPVTSPGFPSCPPACRTLPISAASARLPLRTTAARSPSPTPVSLRVQGSPAHPEPRCLPSHFSAPGPQGEACDRRLPPPAMPWTPVA